MKLINADAIREALEALSYHADKYVVDEEKHGFCTGIAVAIRQTELMPTIEAEPKHGRWIEERSGKALDLVRYHCSECGRWQTWSNFPYCPNCGAKMNEVEHANR